MPEVPRLAGDCYREPEWVCRAAEVTEARETHLLSMSFTWIFNGFYWILMDFGAL